MGEWDAVVDVSNVCWSKALPPVGLEFPVWRRLEPVIAAWRREHGRDARIELVADDSLAAQLQSGDSRLFEEWKRSGRLRTAPVADHLVLDLAAARNLHVISGDKWRDHRRAHAWIETGPDRFHHWTYSDGAVRFRPVGIVPLPMRKVSQAEELKELSAPRVRLDPVRHRDIIQTRWRCPNELCPEMRNWREELLVWPSLRPRRRVVCPGCQGPLTALGPRPPHRDVVVELRNTRTEVLRFPVEWNIPLLLGRGEFAKGVDLAQVAVEFHAAVRKISRRHLSMRLEFAGSEPLLEVVELGSSRGTEIERGRGAGYESPRLIEPGRRVRMTLGDRLVLGGSVTLRLSGRRFRGSEPIPAVGDGEYGPVGATDVSPLDQ
ncbi:hypothetical protein ACFQ08_25590 [Streptosporangium algeriense]|uniref:FHA domain-containing protein n=1 Tax=Streptosporangium algeriense TaxID=1682748 RepID=A0ABW3DVP7_9ACTN